MCNAEIKKRKKTNVKEKLKIVRFVVYALYFKKHLLSSHIVVGNHKFVYELFCFVYYH